MKAKLVLYLLICFSQQLFAQDSLKVWLWEDALKAPRDSVFAIDASRQKWETLPEELFTFTELRSLDLSRNKLTAIEPDFGKLKKLKSLDVSRNKLDEFPIGLCQMTGLRQLMMSRNMMKTIPPCIGYFKELTYLDIWDNPILSLPEELSNVTTLKTIDLRGILFNEAFQNGWRERMPGVNWYFDAPCACMD